MARCEFGISFYGFKTVESGMTRGSYKDVFMCFWSHKSWYQTEGWGTKTKAL